MIKNWVLENGEMKKGEGSDPPPLLLFRSSGGLEPPFLLLGFFGAQKAPWCYRC